CRLADRPGLPGQNEESGLEGVLRVGLRAQHGAADVQHHRPVTAQKGMEGNLVLLGVEAVEELVVREFAHTPVVNRLADELQDRARHGLDHQAVPPSGSCPPYIVPWDSERYWIFFTCSYLLRDVLSADGGGCPGAPAGKCLFSSVPSAERVQST